METLQAKIDRLETELAEINENETFTQDLIDRKNQVTNDLSEARHTLKLQQEQEQAQQLREQKQTQQLDSLGQQIQDMDLFGAVLPEEGFSSVIGLTEYHEKRQALNQIMYTWATDIQRSTFQAHNEEVAELQKQLREAKAESAGQQEQVLQLQRQNEKLQEANNSLTDEVNGYAEANEYLSAELSQAKEETEKGNAAIVENCKLRQMIVELEQKLEEAQKPTPAIQTSQTVQEQIEGLRKKSAESWADKANRGLARFDLPPIGAPDLPPMEVAQPGNTFPTAESTGDPLPATEESVGERFQAGEQSDGLSVVGDGDMEEVVGETIEERVATLERRVAALETSKVMVA